MIEQKSLGTRIIGARVVYYDFFANLFLYELLQKNQENLKQQVGILKQYPLGEKSQIAFDFLEKKLQENTDIILQEYTKSFILSFDKKHHTIPLYLSHYKDGCMGGESLVYVRELLKDGGFYLDKNFTKENEDQLGILCLFAKYLLQQNNEKKAGVVYETCILPIRYGISKSLMQKIESDFYLRAFDIFEEFCILEESLVTPYKV
ncbi:MULTISPECIES: molecular chaperone TorD family protein [unclassified Helicobacter]|uniref:molecular chaperone TorD family protein n=1 Tax=unclassified Helicobacter TaxID=2593540 RepID=UPI000CF14294|nr:MULTISPECIES: molecular chaperone TorD family protein [unclassified Helicobacter]